MIPARLMQQDITIIRATRVTDRYGTETLDWNQATRTTVKGLLQSRGGTEDELGRSQQSTSGVLYLMPGTDVTGQDRVEVAGATYFIVGPPQEVMALNRVHHLLADVRAVEG